MHFLNFVSREETKQGAPFPLIKQSSANHSEPEKLTVNATTS